MDIMIIGAGIGGLTAAIALQRQGHRVRVCEAAPELKPVGAGLWVAPNGQEVLRRIDPELLRQVVSAGFEADGALIMTASGQILSRVDAQSFTDRYAQASTLAVRRSDLHRLLHAALTPDTVVCKRRLERYESDGDKVRVWFADGSSENCDLLVGADGIHSRVRTQLFGALPLRYSGQTCWRGLSPRVLSGDWARRAAEIWADEPGLRAGFSQVDQDTVYFYITALAPAGQHTQAEKAGLMERLSPFPAIVSELVEATPAENLIRADIFDLLPLKSYHRGRVVLLGDAAHATTPNLGQGANQAMESALALANCLDAFPQLSAALAAYEQRRIPKASSVVNTSWQINQMVNLRNPLARRARNFVIRHLPKQLSLKQFDKLYTLSV